MRTLLVAVAGSRKALLPSPETGPETLPEPTPVVRWSADFRSLAAGGCSGSGRFALTRSTSAALSVLLSMMD